MRLVEIYFYFFENDFLTDGFLSFDKNDDRRLLGKYISAGIVSRITKGHRFYA